MAKDYSSAYSEILEILKYIPKEDYEKIPIKLIELFEQNSNEKNEFVYNAGVPFEKQEISHDTKIILAVIYRICWADEREKIEIVKNEKQRKIKIEEEKRKKYNPDSIFKTNKKTAPIKEELKQNYLIEQNDRWYIKLLEKIKQFLNME